MSRAIVDEQLALRRFTREHRGVLDMMRLERLSERLERVGPLAVRHNTWGFCGDRARIELDDDSLLRVKLYWKRDQVLAALVRVFFHREFGWVLVGRSSAGDRVMMYAYHVRVDPMPLPAWPTAPLPVV